MATRQHSFPPVSLDLDFLDGWLAGDGALRRSRPTWNARGCHGTSKPVYAEYVRIRLGAMGLAVSPAVPWHGNSISGHARPGGYTRFQFYTAAHPALTVQHSRWYPHGKKLFPPDFRLSPDSFLQWYLGDGTLQDGRYPIIVVYQPSVSDFDELLGKLVTLFGNVTTHRQSNVKCSNIFFGSGANTRFFDFIGPCPVSDYSYRWPA